MAFSPTNSVCAPISVEHARKQYLSTHLDNRYKLSCSQALCAHVLADYARARILYTMMQEALHMLRKFLQYEVHLGQFSENYS